MALCNSLLRSFTFSYTSMLQLIKPIIITSCLFAWSASLTVILRSSPGPFLLGLLHFFYINNRNFFLFPREYVSSSLFSSSTPAIVQVRLHWNSFCSPHQSISPVLAIYHRPVILNAACHSRHLFSLHYPRSLSFPHSFLTRSCP